MLLLKISLAFFLRCFVTGELVLFAGAMISVLLRLVRYGWDKLEEVNVFPMIGKSCARMRQFCEKARTVLEILSLIGLIGRGQPVLRSPSISHASQLLILDGMRGDFQPLRDVPAFQPLTHAIDVYEHWVKQQWMFGESACQKINALRDHYVDEWINIVRQAGDDQAEGTVQIEINGKVARIAQKLEGEVAKCDFARNKTDPLSHMVMHNLDYFGGIFKAEGMVEDIPSDGQIQNQFANEAKAFARTLTSNSIVNVQKRLANMAAGITRLQENERASIDPCSAEKVRRIKSDWTAASTKNRSLEKRLKKLDEAKLTWQCSSSVQ